MTEDGPADTQLVLRNSSRRIWGLLAVSVVFAVGSAAMLLTTDLTTAATSTTFNPLWAVFGVALAAGSFKYMSGRATAASVAGVAAFLALAAWNAALVIPAAGVVLFGLVGVPVFITQLRTPEAMWISHKQVCWRPRPWRDPICVSLKHVTRFELTSIGGNSIVVMVGNPDAISNKDRPPGTNPEVLAWVSAGGSTTDVGRFVRQANLQLDIPPDPSARTT